MNNLKKICANYSGNSICLCIDDYMDLVNEIPSIIDIQTTADNLRLGYFGDVFGCRIFVAKYIRKNFFKIRKGNDIRKVSDIGWSLEFSVDTNTDVLERYLKLAVFW